MGLGLCACCCLRELVPVLTQGQYHVFNKFTFGSVEYIIEPDEILETGHPHDESIFHMWWGYSTPAPPRISDEPYQMINLLKDNKNRNGGTICCYSTKTGRHQNYQKRQLYGKSMKQLSLLSTTNHK